MKKTAGKQILLLLTFIFSTAIYWIELGFSISGFYVVCATIIILSLTIYYIKRDLIISSQAGILTLLKLTFFLFAILSFVINVEDINGQLSLAMWVNRILLSLTILFSILYFIKSSSIKVLSFLVKRKFLLILFCSLAIQLTLIRITRVPNIDVYQVLKYGPQRILSFENPYETSTTTDKFKSIDFGYSFYAYGPTTIYLFLPFDLILKEPRYLLIIANFTAAFCLYYIAKKFTKEEQFPQLLSLIYLFNPRYIYFLTFSFTDSLIMALVALGLFFYVRKRFNGLAIFLALAVGVKIFYILPYIFFLKHKKLLNLNFIATVIIVLLLIYLPFILHNHQAIYESIVSLNVGDKAPNLLQRYTLTFATFLDRQFGIYPPQKFFLIANLIFIALYWLTIRKTIGMAKILMIVSLVFITSIFWGPFGFANYYYNASQMLLFALAFLGNQKEPIRQ